MTVGDAIPQDTWLQVKEHININFLLMFIIRKIAKNLFPRASCFAITTIFNAYLLNITFTPKLQINTRVAKLYVLQFNICLVLLIAICLQKGRLWLCNLDIAPP
jgi:hypothetical protein